MASEARFEAVDAGRGLVGEQGIGPPLLVGWWRVRALAAALAVAIAGLSAAEAVPADPPTDLPILDLHTHVFNLRYLPVSGILVARGVPKTVAGTLDRLLVGATPLADLSRSADAAPPADAPDLSGMSDMAARSFVLGRIQRADTDRPAGAGGELLSRSERRALRKYVATEPPRADLAPGETGDLALVGAALDKARFAPGREKSYAHFLATLMQDEVAIVRAARRDYPAVDLMIHHLMDLEQAYDDRPSLANAAQISRLAALARRFPGELLGFVAFDPFRRETALPIVRAALDSGAALGVKFYPPSGYRASENAAWPEKPSWWRFGLRGQWNSRYRGWAGEDLNRVNRQLFAYCESYDVPILAHCTPDGFEAVDGYGAMADPRYWRRVLEEFPKLRLTLAHAGGGESWFSDREWTGDADFDQRAWDLATRYENVYLDLSYSDEVLDPAKLAALQRRFAALLPSSHDPLRPYALGDKLVYGSDWHMVAVLVERTRILAVLRDLFDEPALVPYRARFFAGNAVRFLRLGEWNEAAALEPAQHDALSALIARVQATGGRP